MSIVFPSFTLSADILRILIWYTLLAMVGNVLAQALLVQNRQRTVLGLRAIGLSANVGLNLVWLVTLRDPRGAALASVMAEALMLTLLLGQFRAAGYQRRELLAGMGRIALLGAVAGGVMLIAGGVHFLVGIGAGLLVYVVGLWWVLRADDWELLQRVAESLPLIGRFSGRGG
jgi:Na+-driven multidrug efflux pump